MRLLTHASLVERKLSLALNQELRKTPRPYALPDQSGHVAFGMPELDYWYWTHRIPELGAADPDVARRAWKKFLNTDDGAPYKLNRHEGKTRPVDGIIVR